MEAAGDQGVTTGPVAAQFAAPRSVDVASRLPGGSSGRRRPRRRSPEAFPGPFGVENLSPN